MHICQEHNLVSPMVTNRRFGIRVKSRSNDPFTSLVGKDWHREHWYATAAERDEALDEMSGKYVYFRPGDKPALLFEKISR
ncbi:MAG TPA: hypothetical protein VG962_02705 [Steroidobacteraceae bacterium]|nr:hypothetical protein [Steroidobacteraceae bacterium]